VNKKKQKKLCQLGALAEADALQVIKSFLLLFFKKMLLPFPLMFRIRTEYTALHLIGLDRHEKSAEIAFAKTLVTLAFDEFEEDRADRIAGKDLQEHSGDGALIFSQHHGALAIDQNAARAKFGQILAVAGNAGVNLIVVFARWRRHEIQSAAAKLGDRGVNVAAAAGQMLDTLAVVAAEILRRYG